MMKRGLPQVDKYKVVVLSITYNHSQYIEDTLNGFVIQQTNFPFLCCVFDDASTDGEQDVLNQWINSHCNPDEVEIYDHPLTVILMAPDKNNPNCIYAIHLQKVNTFGKPEKRELINYWIQYGEYVAMCEGDDYWIDPLKLQKQVDFLDNNPDYGLCYTNSKSFFQETGKIIENNISKAYRGARAMLFHNPIATLTVVYRKCLFFIYQNEVQPENHNWLMGDYPLWLWFAFNSKIHYINEFTGIYRILKESTSHSMNLQKQTAFSQSVMNVRLYYQEYYFRNDLYCKTLIMDEYYRRNIYCGIVCNDRKYCLENSKCIKNVSFKDFIKRLFFYSKWTFKIVYLKYATT